MPLRILVALAFAAAIASGCNRTEYYATQQETAIMQTPFDPAAAAYVKNLGSATLNGNASITAAGRTFYARGSRIMLIPVNAYSTEYMGYLFRGQPYYDSPRDVENVHAEFTQYMRFAQGDDEGNFVLYGIPQGEYYVYTAIVDSADHIYGVYKRITVADGQTLDVAVDGT